MRRAGRRRAPGRRRARVGFRDAGAQVYVLRAIKEALGARVAREDPTPARRRRAEANGAADAAARAAAARAARVADLKSRRRPVSRWSACPATPGSRSWTRRESPRSTGCRRCAGSRARRATTRGRRRTEPRDATFPARLRRCVRRGSTPTRGARPGLYATGEEATEPKNEPRFLRRRATVRATRTERVTFPAPARTRRRRTPPRRRRARTRLAPKRLVARSAFLDDEAVARRAARPSRRGLRRRRRRTTRAAGSGGHATPADAAFLPTPRDSAQAWGRGGARVSRLTPEQQDAVVWVLGLGVEVAGAAAAGDASWACPARRASRRRWPRARFCAAWRRRSRART